MKAKIIFIIAGLLFVGVGLFLFFKGNELKKNCTKAIDAVVVNYTENFSDDSYTYCPIFEYEVDGNTITKEYSSCSSVKKYSLKSKVSILYNPNKPEEFMVSGDSSLSIFPYVFIGLGALLTVVGIVGKPEQFNNASFNQNI